MTAQTVRPVHRHGPEHGRRIALEILGVVLFLLFMFPFYLVLINSAKVSTEITRSPMAWPSDWAQLGRNLAAVIGSNRFDYPRAFTSSVITTAVSLAVIVLFTSMSAWVLVRSKTRWSNFIFMTFVAALVIPFQVLMLPLLQWLRMVGDFLHIRLLGTYPGIVFCYLGFGSSISIFIFHGFIKSVPLELEEAATIDGCGRCRTFFSIVFPLLQPTVVTLLILNGIWIWNDYLLPLLVLGSNGAIQTLPLAVMNFIGSYVKKWDLILASTVLAMLPIMVLFLFAQKYIIKGMVDGAIK